MRERFCSCLSTSGSATAAAAAACVGRATGFKERLPACLLIRGWHSGSLQLSRPEKTSSSLFIDRRYTCLSPHPAAAATAAAVATARSSPCNAMRCSSDLSGVSSSSSRQCQQPPAADQRRSRAAPESGYQIQSHSLGKFSSLLSLFAFCCSSQQLANRCRERGTARERDR